MKKIMIAVLVLVLLVAGGLGSLAYAQENPVNQVDAHFNSEWIYYLFEDTFLNHEVTGFQHWHANMQNLPDETGAPVNGLTLTLDSELEFGDVYPDPVTMGPPTYEWSFGSNPEGFFATAWVGLRISPDPFPVTYTPGFDASRSADKTEFTEPGSQTLTITLTPREVTEGLGIHVMAVEDDLVNPVITSPTTDEEQGIWLSPDGHDLSINPVGLELDIEYTYTVTIEVTPKVHKVDFMPHVGVFECCYSPASGTTSGSSVSYPVGDPADGIGTWTFSAEGSYEWHWQETVQPSVHFHFWSTQPPIPPVPHESMTGQKLVGWGDFGTIFDIVQAGFGVSFTNPDCVSEITIDRVSIIRGDGEAIFEGKLSELPFDFGDVLKSHQTVRLFLQLCIPDGIGGWLSQEEALALPLASYTVEIFYSVIQEGGLPLIGLTHQQAGPPGAMEFAGMVPMVNMEQVLEPEEGVTVLHLQTWFPADNPSMEPLENFANTVNSQSDLVRIELYPGVPLEEIVDAVRQGDAEMGLIPSTFLGESPSLMDAPQLPFLYNNEDGLMAAVEAGIGDLMTEQIKDMTVLGWTTLGIAHLFSRGAMIDEPGDVAGLKIRSVDIQAEAITEWGGTPVFMPLAEVYQALNMELIDGAIVSAWLYDVFKFYDVAPYFCEGYAFGQLAGLCINNDIWKSLNKNTATQQIIMDAAGAYVGEMLETVKSVEADALEAIKGYEWVEVYTLTPEERAIWREASQPVWDSWILAVGKDGEDIIAIALAHNPLP